MATINCAVFLITILAHSIIILAQTPEETTTISVVTTKALPAPNGALVNIFHWLPLFSGLTTEATISTTALPGSGGSVSETGFSGILPQNRRKRSERRVIRCNFASQGSMACSSCHEVIRCYAMNYGTITTCSGALRYCYRGRCSNTQGALCKTTTESASTPIDLTLTSSSSPTASSSTSSSPSTSSATVTSPSTSTSIVSSASE